MPPSTHPSGRQLILIPHENRKSAKTQPFEGTSVEFRPPALTVASISVGMRDDNKSKKTPTQLFSRQLWRIAHIPSIVSGLEQANVHHRDWKLTFLNQTYLLHLIASWQAFVEELVEFGFWIIESGDADKVQLRLAKAVYYFNTPNRKQIDKLFRKAFQIPYISDNWGYENFTPEDVGDMLDNIIMIRHDIARKARTSVTLCKEVNLENKEFISLLAGLTENAFIKVLTARNYPSAIEFYSRLPAHDRVRG
jgi:hypothetical protein